jgi:hypothetical protein
MLGPGEINSVRAAMGWLELDLPHDALAELHQLPAAAQEDPDVLEIRWMIHAHLRDWDRGIEVTRKLISTAPDRASTWLSHAYATRRASDGGLLQAFYILAPAASRFSDDATIPYNLACYACQLGRGASETMDWFRRALDIGDPKQLIHMALDDSDLAPVRGSILELAGHRGIRVEIR